MARTAISLAVIFLLGSLGLGLLKEGHLGWATVALVLMLVIVRVINLGGSGNQPKGSEGDSS